MTNFICDMLTKVQQKKVFGTLGIIGEENTVAAGFKMTENLSA